MSNPILPFLSVDMAALLAVGACAAALPGRGAALLTAGLAAAGAALCLPSLWLPPIGLTIPAGPPGLHLHFAFGPMPALFLLIILLSGATIAAFPGDGSARTTAFCLGGAILSLLAADGISLLLGSALMCGVIFPDRVRHRGFAALLIPILLASAVFLLTPAGFAPRFDAIRAAPAGADRAGVAAMLTTAGIAGLILLRPHAGGPAKPALIAGVVLPAGIAILIRLMIDLSGQAVQAWWGFVLLTAGGSIAVLLAWRAAADSGIGDAVADMVRRQGGLMLAAAGLALIGHAADLPQARSLALQATMLLAIGCSLAGTLSSLAAGAITAGTGTRRLSRLGGLIHTMPWTSAALSAGLLALSALPPAVGFASLWLLFQALLSAPRTGLLLDQLPLALTALAVALSAAAATAAAVRVIGIAVLGRPRTPSCAGAREIAPPARIILSLLAAACLVGGLFPGLLIRALAAPAVRGLFGSSPGIRGSLTMLSASAASSGYAALPIAALLGCLIGCVIMAQRWHRRDGKAEGLWFGGMKPPIGLPFGEPMAQSAGAGFLPALPGVPAVPAPRLPAPPRIAAIPAAAVLWLVLAAFAVLLLAMAATGAHA